MAVVMRLSRGGSKKRPYYRIVVADKRSPRDGKYLEQIGMYNPLLAKDDEGRVKVDEDRAKYWLGVGAQPSDRVARFLDAAGLREREARNNPNKAKPGDKANERAEEKAGKAAAAEEALKEAEEAAKNAPAEEEVKEETATEDAAPAEAAKTEEAPAEEAKAEDAPAAEETKEEAPKAEEKPAEDVKEDEKSEEKSEG